jgi:hypothetical protein
VTLRCRRSVQALSWNCWRVALPLSVHREHADVAVRASGQDRRCIRRRCVTEPQDHLHSEHAIALMCHPRAPRHRCRSVDLLRCCRWSINATWTRLVSVVACDRSKLQPWRVAPSSTKATHSSDHRARRVASMGHPTMERSVAVCGGSIPWCKHRCSFVAEGPQELRSALVGERSTRCFVPCAPGSNKLLQAVAGWFRRGVLDGNPGQPK